MDLARSVAEVAALVGGRVLGDAGRRLAALRALESAGPEDLAAVFRARPSALAACRAGCLLVGKGSRLAPSAVRSLIVVDDPEGALDAVAAAFGPRESGPAKGVHPQALVEAGAEVEPGAAVGPFVFVSRGARVGAGTRLFPGVFLGEGALVGKDCTLHPHVFVGARCRLGERVLVHPGAVIGADGFGFRQDGEGRHRKSPQVGIVVVGDDVEIGANTTIDRARLEATVIGAGTKLDDQVHVAHNCEVGPHCAVAGQVGLAGGVRLGRKVLVAGRAAIAGGTSVGEGTILGGGAIVLQDVPPGSFLMGWPAVPHREWKRQVLSVRRLPALIARLRRQGGDAGGGGHGVAHGQDGDEVADGSGGVSGT